MVESIERLNQLIKQITKVLSDPILDDQEILKLNEQYNTEVRKFNGEIELCAMFTRTGRKDQAKRLAFDKKLVQRLELLNFRHINDWNQLVEDVGGQIEELRIALAKTVLEELQFNRKLDELLRQYRLLAISHSPLEKRLKVLRELRWIAPEREYWLEDIREHERAYLEELIEQAKKAYSEGDLNILTQIKDKMSSSNWVIPPPQNTIQYIDALIRPLKLSDIKQTINELKGQLEQAYTKLDEEQCRLLVSKLQKLIKEHHVVVTSDVTELLTSVKHWLDEVELQRKEEQEYQQACQRLEQALDERVADLATLENLLANVIKYDRDLPELLKARYTSRVNELKRVHTQKFIIKVAIVSACTIILIVGNVLLGMHYINKKRFNTWHERILQAIEAKDISLSTTLFSTLSKEYPKFLKCPEFEELRARLDKLIENEKHRKQQFAELVKRIEESKDNLGLVQQAQKLALTFEEKRIVQQLKKQVMEELLHRQRIREEKFKQKLTKLEEMYQRIISIDSNELERAKSLATDAYVLISDMLGIKDVSPALRSRVLVIQKSIIEKEKELEQKRLQGAEAKALLAKIFSTLDLDKLDKFIRQFTDHFPAHSLSNDFLVIRELMPYYHAIVAWTNLTETWTSLKITLSSNIKDRLNQIKNYLDVYGDVLYEGGIDEYLKYIEFADEVIKDRNLKGLSKFTMYLNQPIFLSAYVVIIKPYKIYYLPTKNMERDGQLYSFRYYVNVEGDTDTAEFLRKEFKMRIPELAGHIALTQQLIKEIEHFDGNNWETFYLALAEKIRTYKSQACDPILKVNLIYYLLTLSKHNPWISEDINNLLKRISKDKLRTNWVDPVEETSESVRVFCQRYIANLPEFASYIKITNQHIEGLLKKVSEYYVPVAIKTPRGIKTLIRELENGVGYTVHPGSKKLIKIGMFSEGQFIIGRRYNSTIPNGALVFVKRSRK